MSTDIPYHDQKAIMKPNQEKKKVRPYVVDMGLRKGIERAFWLIGFTSGARQSFVKVSILSVLSPVEYARSSDIFTAV